MASVSEPWFRQEKGGASVNIEVHLKSVIRPISFPTVAGSHTMQFPSFDKKEASKKSRNYFGLTT